MFLLQDDPGDVIVNTVQVLVQVQNFIAWLKLEGMLGNGAFLGEGLAHNVSFDIDVVLRFIKFSDLGNFFSWKYRMDYDILSIEETDIGGVENG